MSDTASPTQWSLPSAQNADLAETSKSSRTPPPTVPQEQHYPTKPALQNSATGDVPPVTRHGDYFFADGDVTFKVCNYL